MRSASRGRETRRDGGDDLAGFLEEDLEQLAVDLRAGRVDQLHHLRGRRFRRVFGSESLHRLEHACVAGYRAFLDHAKRRVGLLGDRRVGHDGGIALQLVDGLLELLARRLGRRVLPILVERLHLLLLHFDVERRDRARARGVGFDLDGRGLRQAESLQRRQQHVLRRGRALLQRGDVEAERGQSVGHHFRRLAGPVNGAFGELLHARHHGGVEARGLGELHDHERALHLRELRGKLRELCALFAVAEEGIENLLDVLQVDLHLLPHLEDEQLLLGAACHLVEEASGDRVHRRHRLAAHRRGEPPDDGLRLPREVGAEARIVLERGFDEEQRRGDFERLRFRGRDRARLEGGRELRQSREHSVDVGVGKLRGALGEQHRLLAEGLERRAISRRVLEPGVLLLRRELAQLADQRPQALFIGAAPGAIGRREELLEAVDRLQHADAVGDRARAPDAHQQVAEQALGDAGGSVDELLDLLIQLGEERFYGGPYLEAAEDERVEEARGRGPEGTVRRRTFERLDGQHRRVHLAQGIAGIAALEDAQQPLLVLGPLVCESLREHRLVERLRRLRNLRQRRRKVRIEKIAFVRVALAAGAIELEVGRQEPHRMVHVAGEKHVEIGR